MCQYQAGEAPGVHELTAFFLPQLYASLCASLVFRPMVKRKVSSGNASGGIWIMAG